MFESIYSPLANVGQVLHWSAKSQIDYAEYYLYCYISYNAWYSAATGLTNDREAISELKKRVVIWNDYCEGRVMKRLSFYVDQLAELTQREPLSSANNYWNGEVSSIYDWASLIEYWYQIRCLVVHGAMVRPIYVRLAYETLSLFMDEIISRMNVELNKRDILRMGNDNGKTVNNTSEPLDIWESLDGSVKLKQLRQKLYIKYAAMPDIWQVDMQSSRGS